MILGTYRAEAREKDTILFHTYMTFIQSHSIDPSYKHIRVQGYAFTHCITELLTRGDWTTKANHLITRHDKSFVHNMSYNGCRIRYMVTIMANLEVDYCGEGDGGGYGDEMGNDGH